MNNHDPREHASHGHASHPHTADQNNGDSAAGAHSCCAGKTDDHPAKVRDPVCGMTVKPESPHRFDHAGREPAFAGRRCARIGCLAVRENGVVILAAGRKAFGRQHAAA